MRRIDLIAKLVAPLFISFLDAVSARLALWTVIGSNLASVLIEYSAIAQVYHAVPELADTPEVNGSLHRDIETFEVEDSPTTAHSPTVSLILIWLEHFSSPWLNYFQSPVLLASLSLSILYLTVLSFNAHMVTYLLAIGFSALWIAIFRLISVIVELSATWAAPVLMSRIGPVRSGLWFVTWLFSFAALGVTMLHITAFSQRFSVIALIVGVVLSRIGLWGFDLSVQYLIQEVSAPGQSDGKTVQALIPPLR